MRDLNPSDLNFVVRRLPCALRTFLQKRDYPVIIAGGFLRSVITGDPINDVDLFISTERDVDHLVDNLLSHVGGKTHVTDNAVTLVDVDPPIQVIHRWRFEDLDSCLESFDFTIARAGIQFCCGEWVGRCDDMFYEDLAARRLVYTSPVRVEETGGSALRLLKFHRRGYTSPLSTCAAVVARLISALDAERLELTDEAAVTKILLGLLKEVDQTLAHDE